MVPHMPRARAKDLLLVSKSYKIKIDQYKAGASLEQRTGYEINVLLRKATLDRVELSKTLYLAAVGAARGTNRCFRSATSRAYYSMYHALRAATFFVHGGDDHEEHSKLPAGIPVDFPNRANWENDLKNARLERNRADYDPYPRNDLMFKTIASQMIRKAEDLLPIVRSYLRSKGCQV